MKRLGGRLALEEPGIWRGSLGAYQLRLVETAVAWRRPRQRVMVMYAFSRGFMTNPMGAGQLQPREQVVFKFMAQQVERLSRQGALKILKEHERMSRSFRKYFVKYVLPTLPAKERGAGLDPEQFLAGLSVEQRLAGLSEAEVVQALLPRLPRNIAAEVSEGLRPRKPGPKSRSRSKH